MCVSEICCHRRGASRDFERSRFTSRDHSGVPVAGRHWQSVESAGFRSWPFKIPSSGLPRNTFLLARKSPEEANRLSPSRMEEVNLSDAPPCPLFLPRDAHSKGRNHPS